MTSPQELADRLGATGYLADEDLATVAFLAREMQRPLLLEGDARSYWRPQHLHIS